MSTSSCDAQTFLSMTENESHGKAEKKQKGECYLGQWHASSTYFFQNYLRHVYGGGIQNAILGKNIDRAIFGHDLMKMNQETRSIRSKAMSSEEFDFHLWMVL